MRDFRKLQVWEKAHQLTLAAYRATRPFPPEELYGLTTQIRRSAVSIPANIAEGCGRGTPGERGRFFRISMGSASELEYHLLLARDLSLLGTALYDELNAAVVEVKRMLWSLITQVCRQRASER